MGRSRGQEMRRLQKKLIPVNILVCILCIVAALSLFFMPIVKINMGTLVGNEELKKIVTEIAIKKVDEFVAKAGESADDALDGAESGNPDLGDSGESGGGAETPDGSDPAEGASVRLAAGEEDNGGEAVGGTETPDGGNPDAGDGGETGGSGTDEGSGSESGGDAVSIQDLLKKIDTKELVTPVVDEILGAIEADISVSANNSLKVFMATDKLDKLLDELFFNEASGFISQLDRTLVKGFGSAFEAAGTQVQKAVVSVVVVPALKENLPEEYANLVDEEELQATVESLDNAKSSQEASDTIINYIDSLAEGNDTVDPLTEEQKEEVRKQVTELYDKTVAETRNEETGEDNFSLEAMISVLASEAMAGAGDFNLGSILAGFTNGGSQQEPANPDTDTEGGDDASAVKLMLLGGIVLADGETPPPAEPNPEEPAPEQPAPDESGEGSGEEKEYTKYVSYREMGEGFARGFLGDDFGATLKTMITEKMGSAASYAGYYGYIFMGIGFFILLWVILFLFAFFHMFARNKRFTMWYVKLFCFTPCFIFYVIPLLVKKVLAVAFPAVYTQVMDVIVNFVGEKLNVALTVEQAGGIFNAVLSSFQTFAWISGICYLLLWIISVCWAFPIKHKIRKLKKGN